MLILPPSKSSAPVKARKPCEDTTLMKNIVLRSVGSLGHHYIADLEKRSTDHLAVGCPDVGCCRIGEFDIRAGVRVVKLDPAGIKVDCSDDACVFSGAERFRDNGGGVLLVGL